MLALTVYKAWHSGLSQADKDATRAPTHTMLQRTTLRVLQHMRGAHEDVNVLCRATATVLAVLTSAQMLASWCEAARVQTRDVSLCQRACGSGLGWVQVDRLASHRMKIRSGPHLLTKTGMDCTDI